jgi:hypothetical protein
MDTWIKGTQCFVFPLYTHFAHAGQKHHTRLVHESSWYICLSTFVPATVT